MRSSFAVCGTVLAALFLGSCGGGGGDDGPSAEQEAKTAAVRAVENLDAATFCRKQVSKGYLDRIYDGDVTACVKSEGVGARRGEQRRGDQSRGQAGRNPFAPPSSPQSRRSTKARSPSRG
jgi:hypothetical protein